MKNALLEGVEIGAVFSAIVCLFTGNYPAVLANVAFAAYARYARAA